MEVPRRLVYTPLWHSNYLENHENRSSNVEDCSGHDLIRENIVCNCCRHFQRNTPPLKKKVLKNHYYHCYSLLSVKKVLYWFCRSFTVSDYIFRRKAGDPILSIMFEWRSHASMAKALRSHYRHKSYHTTWMAPAAIIILHFMPRYTKIWIIINLDLSPEQLHFFPILATRQGMEASRFLLLSGHVFFSFNHRSSLSPGKDCYNSHATKKSHTEFIL